MYATLYGRLDANICQTVNIECKIGRRLAKIGDALDEKYKKRHKKKDDMGGASNKLNKSKETNEKSLLSQSLPLTVSFSCIKRVGFVKELINSRMYFLNNLQQSRTLSNEISPRLMKACQSDIT
ncbi:DgyrCDS12976 [Dimorphilus gyrociliatus]|uniref:DgyrCDS12976 n=1 Tax=Dimorphilus gyrociliatus TaxID=2664684 RepID=A0A7I8W9A2_9ANNE|nr:DgyrCDS12976 [Dimorphilus gyrociliatus]